MQIFDKSATTAALPFHELVPAIARAALQRANGELKAPERMVVPIDPASVLLCMPAISSDLSVTKLITVHAENPSRGLPAIQGDVVVFETATGKRLALLDGPTVTARRTAAVTLLGIEKLMHKRPGSALLIGTGPQAQTHAEALAEYFGIRDFVLVARQKDRAQAFKDCLALSYPDAAIAVMDMAALQEASPPVDVLIALTTARSAVIPTTLAPNTLAIGVGAFKPDMVEFPAELLRERSIIVDDRDGAHHEAGDLIQAGIDWSKVRELAEVLDQPAHAGQPLPVFKTVGQAAWDLAAARVAIRRILPRGVR